MVCIEMSGSTLHSMDAHLEFSVLHEMVDAVSIQAGFSGASLPQCGGSEDIATKLSEERRFKDARSVIGAEG